MLNSCNKDEHKGKIHDNNDKAPRGSIHPTCIKMLQPGTEDPPNIQPKPQP